VWVKWRVLPSRLACSLASYSSRSRYLDTCIANISFFHYKWATLYSRISNLKAPVNCVVAISMFWRFGQLRPNFPNIQLMLHDQTYHLNNKDRPALEHKRTDNCDTNSVSISCCRALHWLLTGQLLDLEATQIKKIC